LETIRGFTVVEALSTLLNLAVLVFTVTSMLSVGFSYTLREITQPLLDLRGLFLALAANFVVVPLLAYMVAQLLSLKLTQIAKGDLAFAAGLLVVLLVVTIFYMPIVVPLVAPAARVKAFAIATPLILIMFLPLGLGLLVDAWFERLADRLLPLLKKVSSVALVVLVATTVLTNYHSVLSVFGTGAILAALLVITGAFTTGYLIGGLDIAERRVIALGTAQRNIAAAMVVASQSFEDRRTLVMVVVTSIVSMFVLFPIARIMGKSKGSATEANRGIPPRKSPAL
jgi:BASS family bile acid:Na+ symporter